MNKIYPALQTTNDIIEFILRNDPERKREELYKCSGAELRQLAQKIQSETHLKKIKINLKN